MTIAEIIADARKPASGLMNDHWQRGYAYRQPIIEALITEVERLGAIVEKQRTTEDGVPFGPGSKVYYVDPCGHVQGLDVGLRFQTDSSIPDMVYSPYPIYSTREATEAGRKI